MPVGLAIIVTTKRLGDGTLQTGVAGAALDPATGRLRREARLHAALAGDKFERTCWNEECGSANSATAACEGCGVARYCCRECALEHRPRHSLLCTVL